MKKILLFSSLMIAALFVAKAQVIFDPATYDTVSMHLDPSMKIVNAGGTKYLQVVLKGYNSFISVPTITLGTKQTLSCKMKYTLGNTTADTLTMSQIQAVVQIMDIVDSVPNPFGSGKVPAYTVLSQNPVTGTLVSLSSPVDSRMKFVQRVQFFGQQKISYGATTGDTIWVGKIRAVSTDPTVIFDPREADASGFPSGMSVVSKKDTSYLQIVLAGYGSSLNIDHFTLQTGMTATCKIIYSLGTATADSLTLSKIQEVVILKDLEDSIANPFGSGMVPAFTQMTKNPAVNNIIDLSATLDAREKNVDQLQFYGQVPTQNYAATTGDTMWIGKLTAVDKTAPTVPTSLTGTVNGSDVTLTWTASTDNIAVAGYIITQNGVKIDSVAGTTKSVTGLANGTYVFAVSAVDNSGNKSGAAKDTVMIGSATLVKQNNIASLSIGPNPVSEVLTISSGENIKSVAIFNITGQMMLMNNNFNRLSVRLSVAGLQNGIYLVKVQTANGISVQRILKR